MTTNPFLKKASEDSSERHASVRLPRIAIGRSLRPRSSSRASEVGDTIRVQWTVDPAYAAEGDRTRTHTGELTCLDSIVCVKPADERRGYLRLPILMVESVEKISSKPPKPNPFLVRAGK
jgi:hypothetical protein